jgi:hypothetical protein
MAVKVFLRLSYCKPLLSQLTCCLVCHVIQERTTELGSFERLLSELVEHQNWLLCTEMTLCNQNGICVTSSDMAGRLTTSLTELQVYDSPQEVATENS